MKASSAGASRVPRLRVLAPRLGTGSCFRSAGGQQLSEVARQLRRRDVGRKVEPRLSRTIEKEYVRRVRHALDAANFDEEIVVLPDRPELRGCACQVVELHREIVSRDEAPDGSWRIVRRIDRDREDGDIALVSSETPKCPADVVCDQRADIGATRVKECDKDELAALTGKLDWPPVLIVECEVGRDRRTERPTTHRCRTGRRPVSDRHRDDRTRGARAPAAAAAGEKHHGETAERCRLKRDSCSHPERPSARSRGSFPWHTPMQARRSSALRWSRQQAGSQAHSANSSLLTNLRHSNGRGSGACLHR